MPDDWDEDDDLEELLRGLRRRFEAIFRRYRIRPEDAEDLLQNVMLQFVLKRPQVRNPPAWICQALTLECLMFLRTERRRIVQSVEDTLLEIFGGGDFPDPEREFLRKQLRRWIRKLPRNCQELIRLKYVENLSAKEIAERTGYKPSSVDKVTRRCVARLKRMFDAAANKLAERREKDGDP